MSVYRHIIPATEESFVLRPWGGRMCFLGTPKLVNCSKLTDAAICRIRQGQCHDGHTHGDCDEIICVLSGTGCHSFWDSHNNEFSLTIHPGDVLYIAKNRLHRTLNLSTSNDLELLIINYRTDAQSDPTVSSMIPYDTAQELVKPYGSMINVIQEETCGNTSIKGDFITIQSGKDFYSEIVINEELLFLIDGQTLISYSTNEAGRDFNTNNLGFFHKGEEYRIKNNSKSPAKLFRLRTL